MVCLHNMALRRAMSRHGANNKPVRSILLCFFCKYNITDRSCGNAVA